MDITDRIDLYLEAFIREKTVASTKRIANPFILNSVSANDLRQVVNIPPDLKLNKNTKHAIAEYKGDTYREINYLLRTYRGNLTTVSYDYGRGSSYELTTDLIAALHDCLLATQEGRRTQKEIRFPAKAQAALEDFFEQFPWEPLEVHSDKTVRQTMAARAVAVAESLLDAQYAISYSDLPTHVIYNTQDFFKSKTFITLMTRSQELRDHLKRRDATDMSYDLIQAIATCNVSRDTVVYRAGHPDEFAIPNTESRAKAAVGKILSSDKFLSTSTSVGKAIDFINEEIDNQVLYVITVPKGLHALPVEAVCNQLRIKISQNEMELLFAPGHKIRIDRIEHDAGEIDYLTRARKLPPDANPNPPWGQISDQYLDHYMYDLNGTNYIVYGTLIDDGVTA